MPYSARWTDQFGGKTLSQEWTRSDIGLGWVHCDPQPDPIKIGFAYLKPDPTQKFRSIIGSGFGLDLKKNKSCLGPLFVIFPSALFLFWCIFLYNLDSFLKLTNLLGLFLFWSIFLYNLDSFHKLANLLGLFLGFFLPCLFWCIFCEI